MILLCMLFKDFNKYFTYTFVTLLSVTTNFKTQKRTIVPPLLLHKSKNQYYFVEKQYTKLDFKRINSNDFIDNLWLAIL